MSACLMTGSVWANVITAIIISGLAPTVCPAKKSRVKWKNRPICWFPSSLWLQQISQTRPCQVQPQDPAPGVSSDLPTVAYLGLGRGRGGLRHRSPILLFALLPLSWKGATSLGWPHGWPMHTLLVGFLSGDSVQLEFPRFSLCPPAQGVEINALYCFSLLQGGEAGGDKGGVRDGPQKWEAL